MSQREMKWDGGKNQLSLEQLVQALQKNMGAEARFYLEKRGIYKETAEELRIGYVPARIGFYVAAEDPIGDSFENRVIVPVVNSQGEVVDLVGRAIDHREPKYKSLYGLEEVFFQERTLKDSQDIILCNGVFDAITLQQVHLPGICLPNMLLFKDVHAERLKDKRVFICMGNDETGRREAVRIQSMLAGHSNQAFIVQLPESVRDINDLFVRIREPVDVFVKLLNQSIEETIFAPIAPDIRNVTVFNEEYGKRYRSRGKELATGLAALDGLLAGGLPEGLTIIAGPPGSGKTIFMKQIADRLAASQQPVLYASWDLSQFELWAISIARVLGVSYGSVIRGEHAPEAVYGANQSYMQAGKLQWSLECSRSTTLEQIEAALERITLVAGRPPVVFIDPLHRFLEAGGADKSNSVYQAKEWSRDWNVPVIAALPAERPADLSLDVRSTADLVLALETAGRAADGSRRIFAKALKFRSGEADRAEIRFYEERTQFGDVLW